MTRKKFQRIYFFTILIPFLMTIFPLFSLANHAKPIVLGLPFPLFWIVLWTVLTFAAITVLFFKDPDIDEE